MPAREIVKRLKKVGFEEVTQKGSHLKLRRSKDGVVSTAVVPMHNKDIAISVVARIMQQAKVTWDELDNAK